MACNEPCLQILYAKLIFAKYLPFKIASLVKWETICNLAILQQHKRAIIIKGWSEWTGHENFIITETTILMTLDMAILIVESHGYWSFVIEQWIYLGQFNLSSKRVPLILSSNANFWSLKCGSRLFEPKFQILTDQDA